MAEFKSFIQLCIEGKAKPEDISADVERWHNTEEVAIPLALHDYLGMTWEEYGKWVQDPSILPTIIEAHKEKHERSRSTEVTATDNTHNS